MKKLSKISIVLILLLLICNISNVFAAEADTLKTTEQGWQYTVGTSIVTVTGNQNSSYASTVVVPAKIEGKGIVVELSVFENFSNLRTITFLNKFDAKDNNNNTFITLVNQDEYSAEFQKYLKENVTVYGYSYDESEDVTDVAMYSPKGFATKYGMKFVDLGKKENTLAYAKKSMPESISLDVKESAVMEDWFGVEQKVTEKIKAALKEKGVNLDAIDVYAGFSFEDIHNAFVNLTLMNGNNEYDSASVKVIFSNSNKRDENTAKQVADYLKKLDLDNRRNETFEIGNDQSRYNITIDAVIDKIEKDLGVIAYDGTQKGDEGEDEYYVNGYLYVVKNDIMYACEKFYILAKGIEATTNTTYVADNVAVNTANAKDVVVTADEIDSSNKNYAGLQDKAKAKGYTYALGAYEFKLVQGDISKGINILFNVGTDNNGKKAIVVHLKSDGTYEEFEKTVEDGKVEITVTELSPFYVAINPNSRTLDKSPKAGDNSYVGLAGMIALVSLAISAIVAKKN